MKCREQGSQAGRGLSAGGSCPPFVKTWQGEAAVQLTLFHQEWQDAVGSPAGKALLPPLPQLGLQSGQANFCPWVPSIRTAPGAGGWRGEFSTGRHLLTLGRAVLLPTRGLLIVLIPTGTLRAPEGWFYCASLSPGHLRGRACPRTEDGVEHWSARPQSPHGTSAVARGRWDTGS